MDVLPYKVLVFDNILTNRQVSILNTSKKQKNDLILDHRMYLKIFFFYSLFYIISSLLVNLGSNFVAIDFFLLSVAIS